MSTHTPTPWNLGEQNQYFIYAPLNTHRIAEACIPPDKSVAIKEAKANAAFIVRAVNAHEDMLAALKKVEKYAFKASGDELLMWVQEVIVRAEAK